MNDWFVQLMKQAPQAELRRFDDDSANVQALLSGQVEAVGGNQFYVGRLNERKPNTFENKFPLTALYNGAGTKLGDKQWNATINAFIDKIKANGKLAALYQKHLGLTMPEFPGTVEGVSFTAQ